MSRVIGYQVAVLAVPAAAPWKQVTVPQLRAWCGDAPGERDRPARLLALAPQAGLAWPLFRRVVLADAAASAGVEWVADEATLAEKIRATDRSMGVAGGGVMGEAGLRVLAVATGPAEPALAPTPENVHRGGYPLRLVLHVAFRRADAPRLRRFLRFLLAEETAGVLAPAGYVPLPAGVRNQLVFELQEMR